MLITMNELRNYLKQPEYCLALSDNFCTLQSKGTCPHRCQDGEILGVCVHQVERISVKGVIDQRILDTQSPIYVYPLISLQEEFKEWQVI
jgi:hypothetical protein